MSDSDQFNLWEWLLRSFRPFEAVAGVATVVWFISWLAQWPAPVLYILGTVAATCFCIGVAGHIKSLADRPTLKLGKLWDDSSRLDTDRGAGQVERNQPASAALSAAPSEAALRGEILCLKTEFVLNTWNDYIRVGNTMRDGWGYDCAFTIRLRVTTDSNEPTTVTGFNLVLTGTVLPCECTDLPVDVYFTKRTIPNLGGPPHKVEWEPLKAFPLNTVITRTIGQEGWLRFRCTLLLPEDIHNRILGFKDNVQMRLIAIDGKRESHPVYEGAVSESYCGEIADAAHLTDQWDVPINKDAMR